MLNDKMSEVVWYTTKLKRIQGQKVICSRKSDKLSWLSRVINRSQSNLFTTENNSSRVWGSLSRLWNSLQVRTPAFFASIFGQITPELSEVGRFGAERNWLNTEVQSENLLELTSVEGPAMAVNNACCQTTLHITPLPHRSLLDIKKVKTHSPLHNKV